MHLWGILCCLREAAFPNDAYERTLPFLIPDLPLMHLYEHTPIANFSLRELLDQLECMQLHWGQIISLMGDEGSLDLLKACMARLGFFAHHAFVITDDESQPSLVDDPQHITIVPRTLDHYPSDLEPHMQLCILSRKTLRQTVCLLLCLARVQQIVCQSTLIASHPLEKSVVEALKQHHVEASMDFFNLLQQMMHLAPGMRLVYRTNFAGMYNDVSQVFLFSLCILLFFKITQTTYTRLPTFTIPNMRDNRKSPSRKLSSIPCTCSPSSRSCCPTFPCTTRMTANSPSTVGRGSCAVVPCF